MRNSAKFRGNRSKHNRDIAIFRICAILDFFKLNILTVDTFERVNCVPIPDFEEVGQTIAETCNFSIFQDGGFFKMAAAQILCRSITTLPKYGDFSIFQDGGRGHLRFLNF